MRLHAVTTLNALLDILGAAGESAAEQINAARQFLKEHG